MSAMSAISKKGKKGVAKKGKKGAKGKQTAAAAKGGMQTRSRSHAMGGRQNSRASTCDMRSNQSASEMSEASKRSGSESRDCDSDDDRNVPEDSIEAIEEAIRRFEGKDDLMVQAYRDILKELSPEAN